MPEPTVTVTSLVSPPAAGTTVQAQIDSYLKASDTVGDALDRPLSSLAAETPETPAPPVSTTPVSPAATHKHPSTLTKWATALGITDAEINEMSTPDLSSAVTAIRQLATFSQPAPEPKAPVPSTPAPELGLKWSAKADSIIDPEWREEFATAVAPLVAEIKRLQGLEAELGGVKTHLGQQEHRRTMRGIDGVFQKLGAGYEGVFGTGGVEDVAKDSPEWEARVATIRAAESMPGNFLKNLEAKAKALYGRFATSDGEPASKIKARDPQTGRIAKAEETAEEWAAATVGKPTNRLPAPEPKGERRAAKAIQQLAAQNGRVVNGTIDDLDGFPD